MRKILGYISDYWLIVFSLYATGSIYFVSFYYNTAITALFAVVLIYYIINIRQHSNCLQIKQIVVFIFLVEFIIFMFLLNGVTVFSPYIAILFQIATGLVITWSIPMKDFIRRYVNVLCFFAMVSLVFYCSLLVYPDIALFFPKTIGNASIDYYNAIIHVFGSAKGFSTFVPFMRNSGIFWEPGAYQAFLNTALWFLLYRVDFGKNKYDIWKAILLIITVITTYSTTGYIIVVLILIFNISKLFKHSTQMGLVSLLGVVALIVVMTLYNINNIENTYMSNKLLSEFGIGGNYSKRLFLDDLFILFERPLNTFGISFESYQSRGLSSANSIVHTLVVLGIPFTAVLLWMYYEFCKKYKKSIILFIILLMLFSSESLLWRPIFLCFAWYGINSEHLTKDSKTGAKNIPKFRGAWNVKN